MNIAVIVRVDYVIWLILFALSESVATVISPFVSNPLDRAPL